MQLLFTQGSFPVIKVEGSSVTWLAFSCSCAKSYFSDGPVQQHVGFQPCYSAKNTAKINHKLLHFLGWSHGGIPTVLTVTQRKKGRALGFGMPCSFSARLPGL